MTSSASSVRALAVLHLPLSHVNEHILDLTVCESGELFAETHGLSSWKAWGPVSRHLPCGVLPSDRFRRVLEFLTFREWASMGAEVGIVVAPLQHPRYESVFSSWFHSCGFINKSR